MVFELEFMADRFGFPMIRLPESDLFLSWFPVTKLQFELFLCETLDKDLSSGWYQEILAGNPRLPTSELHRENIWRAFVTGIRREEAVRFARWCGHGHRLPTILEWASAYRLLGSRPPECVPWPGKRDFANSRFRLLYATLTDLLSLSPTEGGAGSLAESCLLEGGILEWVEERFQPMPGRLCGLPHRHFFSTLKSPSDPWVPLGGDQSAGYPFGARLIFDAGAGKETW